MIGKIIANYRITEKLGEGSMGEVFLAEDTELNRRVALKFLPVTAADDADALALFKREARAAAALNHPNIITIHEIGHYEGRPYIAMSYIDGETLKDEMRRGITVDRALAIMIQACDGLAKAHGAGIVHRDIKPDNLISDSDGRVKILDFGIAIFSEPGAHDAITSTAGTAYYMSPEQARGDAVDLRSDIFSLGAILYEMLTGKRPFEGEHTSAIHYSIWNKDPEAVSRLNPAVRPELDRIVARALAKEPDDRYQSAAELADDLRAAQSNAVAPGGAARRRRLVIPGLVAVIALVLFFVVNPFKDRSAVADENILAIMYFENLAQEGDPDRLGEIMTDLLITNFSQSEDLTVVSSQRLYDILKLQGKEGTKVIDRSTATEVARAAGARWMMLGSILQVVPNLIVSTQLVDVATGTIEGSQRLTGSSGETVFTLVDRMTGTAREDLDIPMPLNIGHPKPIADVTTNSLEAYRYYVEGLDYEHKLYFAEALQSYRRAIEIDSTFAMAHYHQAIAGFNSNNFAEGFSALRCANRHIEHASDKERLYIEAMNAMTERRYEEGIAKLNEIIARYPHEKDAYSGLASFYYTMGENEKVIELYEKVIELDPLHKSSYNMLAYTYDRLGNFEKSIEAINRYIELSPGEANPLDTRADLYAYNGRLDEAIDSYQEALEVKPDFVPSIQKLGNMYLYKGMYEEAAAQYRKLTASNEAATRSTGRTCLALIQIYRGRLHEGLAMLETGIAADEMEGFYADSYLTKYFMRAPIYAELGQADRAVAVGEKGYQTVKRMLPMLVVNFDLTGANFLAECGHVEQAESILALHEPAIATFDNGMLMTYHSAKGIIAIRSGDSAGAIRHYETADSLVPNQYLLGYGLATAYLMADRAKDAVSLLEALLNRYDESRVSYPPKAVKGIYLLGTAYEAAGESDKAIAQYRKFLEIWKDADSELKEIADARRRLEQLGAGS